MQAAAAAPSAAPRQRLISPPGHPVRLLGHGAVCRAVLMEQPSGSRTVVKQLAPVLNGHPGARYLLERERLVLHDLQGPGVVAVMDGAPGCIVMEYLPGGDLLSVVGEPARVWLGSLAALARALDRIHGLGWVHRDIRPENALFRSATTPVWIDFQAAAESFTDAGALSRGTSPYASPQQRAGLPPSAQDDVFSFGIMLYQLATGALPATVPLDGVAQGWQNMAPSLRAWALAASAPTRSARPPGVAGLAQILQTLADRNDGDE